MLGVSLRTHKKAIVVVILRVFARIFDKRYFKFPTKILFLFSIRYTAVLDSGLNIIRHNGHFGH
jgi:hypothetical protein